MAIDSKKITELMASMNSHMGEHDKGLDIDGKLLRGFAQGIIECIGEESEGENPKLPDQDDAAGNGGQNPVTDLSPLSIGDTGNDVKLNKKKGGGPNVALLAANLSAKFAQKDK
jgi:hypothetical protein